MHFRIIALFILLVCANVTIGQTKKVNKKKKAAKTESPVELVNKIYRDNIRSIKFHPEGLPTSEPIVNLNSSTKLVLDLMM